MITLVLIVCLAGLPDSCKEIEVPAELNLMECLIYGQSIAKEMLDSMPKYQLLGWKCKAAVVPERGA